MSFCCLLWSPRCVCVGEGRYVAKTCRALLSAVKQLLGSSCIWVLEKPWSCLRLEGSKNSGKAILFTQSLIFMNTVVAREGFWLATKRILISRLVCIFDAELNILFGLVQIYAVTYLDDLMRNDGEPCGKMGNKGKLLWDRSVGISLLR